MDVAEIIRDIGAEKLMRLISLLDGEGLVKTGPSEEASYNDNKARNVWGAFREEYERYIREHHTPAYLTSVKMANGHFEKYFGSKIRIGEVGVKEAEDCIGYFQKKAPKGYRVYYRNLKAMYNKAMAWGYIEKNPFAKIRLPKKQELKPMFLSEAEVRSIIGHITNVTISEVVNFGFYTGCRLNEIMKLKWKNVDMGKRTITIGDVTFTTKTKRQRMVPMCDEIYQLLEGKSQRVRARCEIEGENILQFAVDEAYVFAEGGGKTLTNDYVSKTFKRACGKAGVPKGIHFHTLRHSFASNLVQRGVPLYSVKELLGHESIITTQVYSHLNMDSLRSAVEVFNKNKEGLLSPR